MWDCADRVLRMTASAVQVRGEIERTNKQLAGRSSSMTFQKGGVTVRPSPIFQCLPVKHCRVCSGRADCAP